MRLIPKGYVPEQLKKENESLKACEKAANSDSPGKEPLKWR